MTVTEILTGGVFVVEWDLTDVAGAPETGAVVVGKVTKPNGDFADHFQVPQAEITDVRPGPRGQEVSTSVSVTAGSRKATRPLLFTVTRDGADWCIAAEEPGGHTPAPAVTP